MSAFEKVEIRFSKKRLFLLMIIGLAFIAFGMWMAIATPDIEFLFLEGPASIRIGGIIIALLFSCCVIILFRKQYDDRPALVLDDTAIWHYGGGAAVGEIRWTDIVRVTTGNLQGQHFILIHVVDPQRYIDRQTGIVKRKALSLNHAMYGTPVQIMTGTMDISKEDLLKMIEARLAIH